MTPERAAEIIVNGILKNQARVLVGLDAHAMHHLAKLLGSRYQDVVAKASPKVVPAEGHRPRVTRVTRVTSAATGRRVPVHAPATRPRRADQVGRPAALGVRRPYLGADEHGDWIGFPAGTLMARPGVECVTAERPGRAGPGRSRRGPAPGSATFHGPGGLGGPTST